MLTTSNGTASSRSTSGETLPLDFPETHPIIAQHYFGLELREVREVFWDLPRIGHRLPAQKNVILSEGGRK